MAGENRSVGVDENILIRSEVAAKPLGEQNCPRRRILISDFEVEYESFAFG